MIQIIQNVNTVISLICGLISISMFLCVKKEKEKCMEISNSIDQKIQVLNNDASIQSSDEFNIKRIGTFDNRKSIR